MYTHTQCTVACALLYDASLNVAIMDLPGIDSLFVDLVKPFSLINQSFVFEWRN